MVNNPYVSFAVEDPYQKAAQEAEQRAQLAELLKQQAFQPFEARPAPISRTEGVAKLFAAALAGMTEKQRRETAQKARETDISQAISELERISKGADQDVTTGEMFGLKREDLQRMTAAPGQVEFTSTAPELEVSDTGEFMGYKPSTITGGPSPEMQFQLPEMTPQQKRSAYVRMLGGGPVTQAFGQMGIEQLGKAPQYADIAAPSAKDFTPNSLAEYRRTGDPSVLVRATEPDKGPTIGTPGFGDFTTESLLKYQQTGDPRVLVEKPKAPREVDQGATDARRFRQEDTLRTNFENRTKTYREEVDATGKVIEIQRNIVPGQKLDPVAQQSIVILLNKFLDPGSVVREGEFDRTARGQGMIRQAALLKDKLLKGDFIDQKTIDQITDLAESYQTIASGKIHNIAKEYESLANRRGLEVESIVLNPEFLLPPISRAEPTRTGGGPGRRTRIPGAPPENPASTGVDINAANAIVRGGR